MLRKLLLLSAAVALGCAALTGCQTTPYYGIDHEDRNFVPAELR